MPRHAHTDIGDSEFPGGMKTYCSPSGRSDPKQGQLPGDFWSNVAFKTGLGPKGKKYAQRESLIISSNSRHWLNVVPSVTGCIRPAKLDRLNVNDGGGQYDSSGGAGGLGNPKGSVCLGYKHYVELVEPGAKRACIKCCDDFKDCPLHLGESIYNFLPGY